MRAVLANRRAAAGCKTVIRQLLAALLAELHDENSKQNQSHNKNGNLNHQVDRVICADGHAAWHFPLDLLASISARSATRLGRSMKIDEPSDGDDYHGCTDKAEHDWGCLR
jgi:hypothetical protein